MTMPAPLLPGQRDRSMRAARDPKVGTEKRSRSPLNQSARVSFPSKLPRRTIMPASVIDIEAQALGLTPEQRAHLAGKLLSSLSPDAAIEEAWPAEAIRRLEEMDNGSVTGIPVEETILRAKTVVSHGIGAA